MQKTLSKISKRLYGCLAMAFNGAGAVYAFYMGQAGETYGDPHGTYALAGALAFESAALGIILWLKSKKDKSAEKSGTTIDDTFRLSGKDILSKQGDAKVTKVDAIEDKIFGFTPGEINGSTQIHNPIRAQT